MKQVVLLFSLCMLLAGCQSTDIPPDPSILRVGVTPNSHPMIFKQNGTISGVEADFARRLGAELNREIVFVEVPWGDQIDYLEQNRTDIIMSNMSVTEPRFMRINFSNPYMQSGLSALFRRDNADPAGLLASTVKNQLQRVGYIQNTTSRFFCIQRFPRAKQVSYPDVPSAVTALKSGKIDFFIYDAPVIWWNAAVNENDLVSFPELLNIEMLAWGISKQNTALLDQVNVALSQWEADGTVDDIISNWIPLYAPRP